jgi:hypothetical protein
LNDCTNIRAPRNAILLALPHVAEIETVFMFFFFFFFLQLPKKTKEIEKKINELEVKDRAKGRRYVILAQAYSRKKGRIGAFDVLTGAAAKTTQ